MNQDVRRVALVYQIPVVARLVFETRIRGLDEDVRLEAGPAKNALDTEYFVADGVSIAERRKYLMDFLRLQFNTGPDGSSVSTSAAGRNDRRRLSSQPGSGSMPVGI